MGGRLIKYRPVHGLKYAVPLFVMPGIIHGNGLGFSPGASSIDERPVAHLLLHFYLRLYLFALQFHGLPRLRMQSCDGIYFRKSLSSGNRHSPVAMPHRCPGHKARPKVHANISRPVSASVSSPLYSLQLRSTKVSGSYRKRDENWSNRTDETTLKIVRLISAFYYYLIKNKTRICDISLNKYVKKICRKKYRKKRRKA